MKKFLLFMMVSVLTLSLSAQSISSDVYWTSRSQLGVNMYKTTSSGFVYGIGGSYLMKSYKGEVFPRYEELANYALPYDGSQWQAPYKSAYYKTFIEDRGSVEALIGFNVGNLTIYGSGGLGFQTQYWCG